MVETGGTTQVVKEDFKKLLRRRFPQYIATTAACMGGFSLGCCVGWSAPCVELLKEKYNYTEFLTDIIAAVLPLGCALGMPVVPFLVDKIGRKWMMLSLAPVFLVGWIFIIAGVSELSLLIVGRLLTGACGGMYCVVAPMYCAEISEKHIRGTLGMFFQLLLVLGILYAFSCGYSKSVIITSLLCAIGPIIFALMMIFMPESPLYYMSKDNEEAARKSMRYFRGPDYNIDPEIADFKEQIEWSRHHTVSLSIFMKKPVLKTMGVAFGLMFAQQFSGIDAIIFYCETIFKQTGVDMDPLLQMMIVAIVQVIAGIIAVILIDQLGRKVLLIISFSVMTLCLVCLGFFFILKKNNPDAAENLFWLPLVSACVYILAFCIGAGPIPWAYMSEIFPTKLKGTASSAASLFNWMVAFIVTVSFSSMIHAIGIAASFFIFGIVCVLSIVFVIFCVIETRGKTFTEILKEFGTHEIDN
ncbi:Facilitated trehalose transporter Tret1 [Anthophora quadrimaculata]